MTQSLKQTYVICHLQNHLNQESFPFFDYDSQYDTHTHKTKTNTVINIFALKITLSQCPTTHKERPKVLEALFSNACLKNKHL